MFFEIHIKKILRISFKKRMKKNWFKGASVAPNSMVGPICNFVFEINDCYSLEVYFRFELYHITTLYLIK
jgi:hypothetical protein